MGVEIEVSPWEPRIVPSDPGGFLQGRISTRGHPLFITLPDQATNEPGVKVSFPLPAWIQIVGLAKFDPPALLDVRWVS